MQVWKFVVLFQSSEPSYHCCVSMMHYRRVMWNPIQPWVRETVGKYLLYLQANSKLPKKHWWLPFNHRIPELHSQRPCHTGTASGHKCIDGSSIVSCFGQEDGDYQDCKSCSVYHKCIGGLTIANYPCEEGLVWHAPSFGSGYCRSPSLTCKECQ